MENTSGLGKEAIVPDEVRGWSWGAFLMTFIWGLFNRTWIALATFIPLVGVVVWILLGLKGNEWAWRNKRWDDVEHFQRVQRNWAIAGFVLLLLPIVAIGVAVFALGVNMGDVFDEETTVSAPSEPAPAPSKAASVPPPAAKAPASAPAPAASKAPVQAAAPEAKAAPPAASPASPTPATPPVAVAAVADKPAVAAETPKATARPAASPAPAPPEAKAATATASRATTAAAGPGRKAPPAPSGDIDDGEPRLATRPSSVVPALGFATPDAVEPVRLIPTMPSPRYNDIMSAVVAGDEAGVRETIAFGKFVDRRDSNGFTPLMVAAVRGELGMARLLLEAGADPLLAGSEGQSAMGVARANGDTGMVALLRRYGVPEK